MTSRNHTGTSRIRTGAIVAVLLAVGVWLVVSGRGGSLDPKASTTLSPPVSPAVAVGGGGDGPGSGEASSGEDLPGVAFDGGVVEWARTEEGARRAAVGLLEFSEDVVTVSPVEAAEAQRAVSTVGSADRLASEVETAMRDLVAQAPGGVEVSVAPISARSTPVGEGWEVSIWYVQVLAVGTQMTVESWHTATYTLEWEDATWKVADVVVVDGPTPSAGPVAPTPPVELVGVLAAYDDIDLTIDPGR